MNDGDRKGFAAKVAKGYGKSDGDDAGSSKEEPESDDEASKESAGTELADAIKSGDGKEIYSAIEALVELCKGG